MSGKIITSRRPCPTTPPCELEDLIGYPYDIPSRCVPPSTANSPKTPSGITPNLRKVNHIKNYAAFSKVVLAPLLKRPATTDQSQPLTLISQ